MMKLTFNVDGGEYINAGMASSKLKKTLKQLGLPPQTIRKVSVAVYEAEINMVIHANGGVINAEISPEEIYIHLKDEGPGIADLDQAMTAGYSTANNIAREMGFGAGMGLPNIKRMSDELSITSEVGVGTEVEIRIKPGG